MLVWVRPNMLNINFEVLLVVVIFIVVLLECLL